MLTTKGLLMGCGEEKYILAKAKDADLWILKWEEVHRIHREMVLPYVDRVNAPVMEGDDRTSDFAKDGAMLDGGEMAQIGTSTVQLKEKVHAALPSAASFSLLGGGVERL